MESNSGHFKVGNDSSFDMRGDTLDTQIKETARALAVKLLRFHIHDWLAIAGLIIIDVILNIIKPFYRYVGETMIGDYMFPLKDNTVPVLVVPVIALLIPIAIFIVYFLVKKDVVDLHHAILGLFFSVLITAVITDAVKDAVGRPRPNFFWRCFPDGIAVYDNVTRQVICHGDPLVIKEGHKSFPSGHTSWCFAGLGFLSLYIAGKLQIFDRRGHVGKTAIVLLPILGALLVGLSRVDDYWHHWQDVFAGALIGLTMSFFCYHQFFPSVHLEIGRQTHCDAHTREKAPFLFGFQIFGRKGPSDWPPSSNGHHPDDDMDNLGRGDIRLV